MPHKDISITVNSLYEFLLICTLISEYECMCSLAVLPSEDDTSPISIVLSYYKSVKRIDNIITYEDVLGNKQFKHTHTYPVVMFSNKYLSGGSDRTETVTAIKEGSNFVITVTNDVITYKVCLYIPKVFIPYTKNTLGILQNKVDVTIKRLLIDNIHAIKNIYLP